MLLTSTIVTHGPSFSYGRREGPAGGRGVVCVGVHSLVFVRSLSQHYLATRYQKTVQYCGQAVHNRKEKGVTADGQAAAPCMQP